MTQQILIDISDHYPFGEIQQNYTKARIRVRKMIFYSNNSQYAQIKQKIEILKQLRQSSLIRLINVLEGENQFHLIYQYIPNKYENSKKYFQKDQISGMKKKLGDLGIVLFDKKIFTQLEKKNLGIDRFLELRYYLDIESFHLRQENQNTAKNQYFNQVNRIFQEYLESCFNSQQSYVSNKQQEYKATILKSDIKKYQTSQREGSEIFKKTLSFDNQKNEALRKIGSLQALNKIEQKINELNRNSKKYSPVVKDLNNYDESLRETVKQNWKNKDPRKMSGHTNYQTNFMKKGQNTNSKIMKTPPKVKHPIQEQSISTKSNRFIQQQQQVVVQRTIIQSKKKIMNQQFKQRDIFFHKPSQIINQKKVDNQKRKQPYSKKDFEEIKKNQFQNFFNSKETYVHEFLDVLREDHPEIQKNHISDMNSKPPLVPPPRSEKQLLPRSRKNEPYSSIFQKSNLNYLNSYEQIPKSQKTQKRQRQKIQKVLPQSSTITKRNKQQQKLEIDQLNRIEFNKSRSLNKNKSIQNKFLNNNQEIQKVNSMRGMPSHREEIKVRVSKAIQNTDIALEKFRKNSIYSVHTQFHMKK